MKNSPEHILKKMYTSEKRSWFNDCGFESTTSLSLTHVVPDVVMAVTGNTTIKLEMDQYLLAGSTPTAVFETMRVDTRVFFYPQRLATRGIYGNNITEGVNLEQLPLPRADLRFGERSILRNDDFSWDDVKVIPMILRGSLLNRLGCAPMISIPKVEGASADSTGIVRPLNSKHLIGSVAETNRSNLGSVPYYVNYAVVTAYYDICRSFLANKFEDSVPIVRPRVSTLTGTGSAPVVTGLSDSENVSWYSLATFGEFINKVRGVMNYDEATDSTWGESYSLSRMMYGPNYNDYESYMHEGLYFNDIQLMDYLTTGSFPVTENLAVRPLVEQLENEISNTGLWPVRYDSHYQTMFFKPEDIENIMTIDIANDNGDVNVRSFRLAESKFTLGLKSILRGRTTEDWIDVQFGTKLKIKDKPIFVGGDSFIVNFQQIVANAQSVNSEGEVSVHLGDTGGRGVGGSQRAFNEQGVNTKAITFTTQEPGYLIVLVSCTPNVAYSDVHDRLHSYDTLSDFPLPAYDGKLFQSLQVKDLVFTGTKYDDLELGSQPYGFDHMTAYNRVSGLYGTKMKSSFVFKRDFDFSAVNNATAEEQLKRYLTSVYVEPHIFDQNFNDVGVNAYQNFTLKSAYNLRKCMPFEKQVTDYSI